jgi:hypothetical protein
MRDTWLLGPRAVFPTSCLSDIESVYGVAHLHITRSGMGEILIRRPIYYRMFIIARHSFTELYREV